MPSFDIVSSVDQHEVANAVDQANRELETRFDFKEAFKKGEAKFELTKNNEIQVTAPTDFQIQQMKDILRQKCVKRNIDTRSLTDLPVEKNLSEVRLTIQIQQGIKPDIAKKIVKSIKGVKLKVQPAIQSDKIRVTGKKRDELQQVISHLKEHEEEFETALQYENFRD